MGDVTSIPSFGENFESIRTTVRQNAAAGHLARVVWRGDRILSALQALPDQACIFLPTLESAALILGALEYLYGILWNTRVSSSRSWIFPFFIASGNTDMATYRLMM
ncbi:hypothetical protein GOP47_0012689 [Adiantum capillus-veneris]|uniref:Uncharacterized protein n=1 Tax=Adiantum capillus-veneris TaxID=13818 RepID=A0A9D4UR60_ADICA|nr:hypothetical protein GOP47_0012689 [Adiantum capillus-veneris]